MLKQVRYKRFGDAGTLGGLVKYLLLGDNCIFSGVTLPSQYATTANAPEAVISAICGAEQIDPLRIKFFDLQTKFGYPDMQEGAYLFQQLTVEKPNGNIRVSTQVDTACTPDVLEEFGLTQMSI